MPFTPFAPVTAGLRKLAGTGLPGYTLINGTGTIITATLPNDGNLHSCLIVASLFVSVTETGGVIAVTASTPDGASPTFTLISGNQAGGHFGPTNPQFAMQSIAPGGTISVTQFSALTVGAAILYAEIWGS